MDVSSYMKSLYRLRALRPRILYPGHGPHVREGIELLNRYILHRTSREQQVQKVLAERAESASFTTREIVDRLYTDMTTEKVRMALENVQRILMKLGKDGKAQPLRLVPRSRDRPRISLALATETRIAGPADTPQPAQHAGDANEVWAPYAIPWYLSMGHELPSGLRWTLADQDSTQTEQEGQDDNASAAKL